jgi:uncharacterized protein (TIGR02246 family)
MDRTEDERAVRELVDDFLRASGEGDVDAVLDLLTDDVVFLTPGNEPFGKETFGEAARQQLGAMEAVSHIQEVEVGDDWAWMRSHLTVTMTPPGGEPIHRTGATLTILRKTDGRWRIARDANLLA